jgi:hypothetical protein
VETGPTQELSVKSVSLQAKQLLGFQGNAWAQSFENETQNRPFVLKCGSYLWDLSLNAPLKDEAFK